jgi:hypothetical protein
MQSIDTNRHRALRQLTCKKVVAQGPSIKIAIGFVLNIWLRFAKNGERLESPHRSAISDLAL